MTDFSQKVVLITGGSSGIGLAIAFAFGKQKANIAITGRNEINLQTALVSLEQAGIRAIAIVADVSQQEDCANMIKQTVDYYGQLDVLVNNAGMSMRAMFADLDLVVLEKLFAVNFWGAIYSTKLALPYLLEAKGQIINISSIAGLRALPGRTGYSSSKAALQGFMEALRVELLYSGVHVLMVYPGYTATNIRKTALNQDGVAQKENPLDESKLMSAEEVALQTVKAAKQRKRDLVLTTQGRLTALLNKLIPGIMDKMVYNFMKREGDLR